MSLVQNAARIFVERARIPKYLYLDIAPFPTHTHDLGPRYWYPEA